MVPAVAHLRNMVVLLAPVTLKQVQVRPDLPVNLTPRDTVGFTHKGHEFLEIPVLIHYVFSPHLPVAVNEVRALVATQHLSLFLGE